MGLFSDLHNLAIHALKTADARMTVYENDIDTKIRNRKLHGTSTSRTVNSNRSTRKPVNRRS